jgi:hypothetical protein
VRSSLKADPIDQVRACVSFRELSQLTKEV